MPTAIIDSNGAITLPKQILEHLGVEPGDVISLQVAPGGEVVVATATVDIRTLRGMLKPRVPAVSLKAMNRAIRRGATGR